MKQANTLRRIQGTTQIYLRKKDYLVYSVVLDFLFLLSYGFFVAGIFPKIINTVTTIGGGVAEQAGSITGSIFRGQSLVATLLQIPSVKENVINLIILFAFLAAGVYILWSFFQGTTLWLAFAMAKKEYEYSDFLIGYLKLTAFWFIFFSIGHVGSVVLTFYQLKGQQVDLLGIGLWIYFVLVFYFSAISYGTMAILQQPLRKTIPKEIKRGVQGLYALIPTLVVLLVLGLVLQILLTLSGRIGQTMFLIIGIIFVFPAITWARIFWIKSIRIIGS